MIDRGHGDDHDITRPQLASTIVIDRCSPKHANPIYVFGNTAKLSMGGDEEALLMNDVKVDGNFGKHVFGGVRYLVKI